jgi:D-methionine transport system substrate-binding protein
MKKFKRFTSISAAFVLGVTLLTACGTKDSNTGASPTKAEDDKGLVEIVVGASIEPHATILNSEAVKNSLEADGFTIKVVEFTDYIQPNVATSDGSLDANFFQHTPYLNEYNEKNKTVLKAVANTHFEPLGIYAGKTDSIENVPDKGQIAVPNDATNEARALLLLEKAGIITLEDNIGLDATIKNIVSNPKNLTIIEVEAAQTAKSLKDVDLAVINGNYALTEGLSASEDGLLVEDANSEAATTYPNIIVVNEGNEESDKTKALIKAVTSEETKKFIEERWQGAVVPVF